MSVLYAKLKACLNISRLVDGSGQVKKTLSDEHRPKAYLVFQIKLTKDGNVLLREMVSTDLYLFSVIASDTLDRPYKAPLQLVHRCPSYADSYQAGFNCSSRYGAR